MISVNNLCKHFDKHKVVDNLSFEINTGEIAAFLGPNGAGKSTTMKMLTGFLKPSSGDITIDDRRYSDSNKSAISIKSSIGYLPEGAPAYSEMTVYQFLKFITQIRKIPKPKRAQAIQSVVEQVELEKVLDKQIENLSKGFKRRVGIAQAIIHDPKILILDEPTDGLDPNQKYQVRELIKNLAKDKLIIISTHILEEVTALCNRVIVISDGKKCFDDSPEGLRAMSPFYNAVSLKLSYLSDISGLLELDGVAEMRHDKETGLVTVFPEPGKQILSQVSAHIQLKHLPVDMVFPHEVKLDDVFRRVTSSSFLENE